MTSHRRIRARNAGLDKVRRVTLRVAGGGLVLSGGIAALASATYGGSTHRRIVTYRSQQGLAVSPPTTTTPVAPLTDPTLPPTTTASSVPTTGHLTTPTTAAPPTTLGPPRYTPQTQPPTQYTPPPVVVTGGS